MCVFSHVQLCATPWTDCSSPGSSTHGILQARILEWVVMPSSRWSSRPRDWTRVSCVSWMGRWVLYHWSSWEALFTRSLVYYERIGYNSGRARWMRCRGQDTWEGPGIPYPLDVLFFPHLHLFINLEAQWTLSFWGLHYRGMTDCNTSFWGTSLHRHNWLSFRPPMVTKLNLQPHSLLGGQVEEGEGRLQGPPSHHKVSSPSNQAPFLG